MRARKRWGVVAALVLMSAIVVGNSNGSTASDISGSLSAAQSSYNLIGTGGAGGLRVGLGDGVGVEAAAQAQHLGVDRRPAPPRLLQLFEDQHAGPLPQHKAVALTVEGA